MNQTNGDKFFGLFLGLFIAFVIGIIILSLGHYQIMNPTPVCERTVGVGSHFIDIQNGQIVCSHAQELTKTTSDAVVIKDVYPK